MKEQINYEKSRSVFSAIESANPGQGVITAIAAMSQLLSNENKEQAGAQREKTETTNEILQGINISINSLPEKIAALIKNPNSPSPTGGGLDIFNGFGPLQSLENVNVNTASGNMGQSVPLSESAQTASAEGENQGTGWASALLLLRGYAKGLAIDLQQFGPGGEALSAFIAGGQELLTSLETIKSAFSTTGLTATEKFVGALQGVSSAIGAIGAISQASADTAVAAIDREISAEKARDGQSKESLSRIKELEAKKEGIRKKAFEQNKKLQTAQAIVNVAAGITQAFASLPFPANIAAAAVMAALGAAQIAAISSQTYGGSSGGGVNAPSEQGTLAVGKRKTEVDLATSRSAAGEIAYFRGEKGIGGPENFKPAFMGAKYRAEGGPTTGYVVGEQGPELFIPEMPGRILENDTIESTQSPTNFNFNINTIDASGVEDILVKQQGNIIGMVRAAANSYGQEFLEPVEIASFTPTAAGVTKY